MGALKQLVYSTRVGAGSGGMSVMPLVGNLLKAVASLGPEAEAAVLAITAVAAAMTVMAQAGMKAAEYGVGFTQARYLGGGSAAETAQLGGYGSAAGVSSQQMAQMAQAYNQALMNNPYAAAKAAAGGYSPNYAGAFGTDRDIDDTRRLLAGLRDMLSTRRDSDAIRMARGTPLEQLLWMRQADPAVINQAMATSQMQLSPDQQREAANAQIMLNTAMTQMQIIMVQLGQMVLPWLIQNLSYVIAAFMMARQEIYMFQMAMYEVFKWLHDHTGGLVPSGAKPTTGFDDYNRQQADAQARQTDATERNTDAQVQNTRALNNHRQVFGGEENAKNSLPDKYFQPNNARYTKDQIHLGQIPI